MFFNKLYLCYYKCIDNCVIKGCYMLLDKANIIRQNRKSVKITIREGGVLTVYSPLNLSYCKIEEIIKTKEKFLLKKINIATKIKKDNSDIINYKKILLLGKEYYIIPTEKVGKAYFVDDNFLVPKRCEDRAKLINFIRKTLREIATRVINNRIKEILKNYPKFDKIKQISIGSFKSKWGSCDSLKNLKFNWKVIMLNPKLIDFIIFHELTHLKELNHSQNFYRELENVLPEHKRYRAELKYCSFLLNIY